MNLMYLTFLLMYNDIGKLCPAQGVLTDPLLTVAELLLNPKLCGVNNENVRLEYEEVRTDAGDDLIIGNFNTSMFARKTEAEVKRKWGTDVKPLYLMFRYDKTELTVSEQKTGFPIFVQPLCFTNDVLQTEKALECVGFLPELVQEDTILMSILYDSGIELIGKQEEA